jgi:hypothetical protein
VASDAPITPELRAAEQRVRDELARLGADPESAPAVPAAVTARITAALRQAATEPTRNAPGG